jgi:hypothetical protein
MATYTLPADHPVKTPILTGVLAQIVAAEARAEGRRATAFPTLVRYSDAGKCARAIALEQLLPEEEAQGELDVAGEFRMWLGSLIHEHMQQAIIDTYGGVAEKTSSLGEVEHVDDDGNLLFATLMAGHADWTGIIADTDLGKICYELKTVGAFAFDQSIGLNRKAYVRREPHGPKASAKIQGALNAVANDCDTLIIGSISMEAVSIQLAEKTDMSNLDRICAEWWYKRSQFAPWANDELVRAGAIDQTLSLGLLPPRTAVGDEMEMVQLTPENVQSDTGVAKQWQCAYCRVRDTCVKLGPGTIALDQIGASC